MKTNNINSPNFGTKVFIRDISLLSSPKNLPYSPEVFKTIKGMENFPSKQVDKFCKIISNFSNKVSKDKRNYFTMQILGETSADNLLVSSYFHTPKNPFVALHDLVLMPLNTKQLKAALEKEYSRLLNLNA